MLAAVVFWAVQQIVGRAFYAHQDTLTPALAGTAATALSLPLYYYGASYFGAPGVAAAGTLAVILYTLVLWQIWQRRFGRQGLSGVAGMALRSLLVSLPACAGAFALNRLMLPLFPEDSLLSAFLRICVTGLAFGGVYLGLARIFAPALCAPLAAVVRRFRK